MSSAGANPSGGRSALRVAARLARREITRRPWRTLLATLLVAVPVAGMVVAAVFVRTDAQSPLERWRADSGRADLSATPGAAGSSGATLDEVLPPGSRAVSYRLEFDRLLRTTSGARSSVEVTDLPMADPIASPILQVTSGRAPRTTGEVFLTRAAARDLDAGVGDRLRLERPDVGTWTIVGVGEKSAWWNSRLVVLGPGTDFPWRAEDQGIGTRAVLVDLPDDVTAAQLAALSAFPDGVAFAPGVAPPGLPGASVEAAGSDAFGKVAWSWVIGSVALTVVGIVIAAAFAAGARRQLMMLGQLAANGAAPRTLRRVLFLQGTWTGLVGATLGLGLAAATLAVGAPHLDNLLDRSVDSYTIRLADLIPIVLLGVAAATLAALVPARTTARIPVLAALAGRRPLRPVPGWLVGGGVAVSAVGLGLLGLAALGANGGGTTVWTLTAVIGGVAILLGACAVAPGYVSVLERAAGHLRGPTRLAARSLARQRTRSGAVVSAICATSALAVAAAALLPASTQEDDEPEWMRPDEIVLSAATWSPGAEGAESERRPVEVPDAYLQEVREAIPGTEVHHISTVGPADAGPDAQWEIRDFVPATPSPTIDAVSPLPIGNPQFAIADMELLRRYDVPAEVARALDESGVVALSPLSVSGTATAALVRYRYDEFDSPAPTTEELGPAVEIRVVPGAGVPLGAIPRILITASRAERLGLVPQAGLVVLRAPMPLSGDDRTRLQFIDEDYRDRIADAAGPGAAAVTVNSDVLHPEEALDPRLVEAVLTAAALVLCLFVVAVSLALAAAETRDERDVLVVVGAPPPTMRQTSGRKALLLSVLGASMGVPVGFLPVAVFTAADGSDLPLVFPWRIVVLLVVAVPIVAAVVTGTFSGIALRLRPVRISTMAFD